jgi:hypothetical protein
MKNLKLIPVLFAQSFFLESCYSYDSYPLSQTNFNTAIIVELTTLDNAYILFKSAKKNYFAGFTIDSDGLNTPTLVEINREDGQQKSWSFNDIIADIFIVNNRVSVALNGGATFSLVDRKWQPNQLTFPANPQIIYSDEKGHIIACSPSPLPKEDLGTGQCQSYNPRWKISVPWRSIKPKICEDYLHVVTWPDPKKLLFIDRISGEIIDTKMYKGGDLCEQHPPASYR